MSIIIAIIALLLLIILLIKASINDMKSNIIEINKEIKYFQYHNNLLTFKSISPKMREVYLRNKRKEIYHG